MCNGISSHMSSALDEDRLTVGSIRVGPVKLKGQALGSEGISRLSTSAAVLLALVGIISLALTLRLWGIRFGLPYAYHIDEPTYVSAALNLGARIIGRQPNPTGFSNILFGEYGLYFVLGRLAGLFSSTADFEQAYRTDPSVFMLLGRLTSVALGTSSVLMVYWLGREIRDRIVGLLASLFLALAFLHVRDSHYAVPDVAMTFFVTLSVLMCIYAVQRQNRWNLTIAAAAGGFAIATKWSAFPILIPLAITLFYYYGEFLRHEVPMRANRFKFDVLIFFISLLGGFLVGGFQLLLQPITFISYALREAQAGDAGGFGAWQVDTVSGWVFYLKTLSYGLGAVLLALGIIGGLSYLLIILRRKDKAGFLILAFPLTYYLLMGTTRHYFARYTLPLIPFMTLFAAEVIVATSAWMSNRWTRLGQGLAGVLILVAITQPLAYSIRHNVLLTRQDTRTIAKHWIEANIPNGAKIATDWPVHGPPLSTLDRKMPNSARVYDVTYLGGTITGGIGLSDHPVAWYRDQGFNYLVASSFIYSIPLVFEDLELERQAFYASLDQELELVQEFRPYTGDHEPPFIFDEIYGPALSLWQRERPGPTLKMYRIER